MNKNKQYGFSLIEILMVIFIMTLCSASAIYSWRFYQLKIELVDTSRQLFNFIIKTQQNANWYNVNYHLNYEENQKRINVILMKKSQKTTVIDHYALPSKAIVLAYPSEPIIFYGKRNMASGGTLKLTNSVGSLNIIISSKGRIRQCCTGVILAGIPIC